VPRLIEDALDRTLRILTRLARTEPDIALVFAQLGIARTREGLAALLERRLVAWPALDRFLARGPSNLTAEAVCRGAVDRLEAILGRVPGGLERFLDDGPTGHPRYQLLARELRRLHSLRTAPNAEVRAALDRVALHFLTGEGKPRRSAHIQPYKAQHYPSEAMGKRHRALVLELGQAVQSLLFEFNRDLNVVLARGIRRMFAAALEQYRRTLDERSVLDFSDVLERALELLRRMDEFAQSRFRLEARYHHVLVDEFQDTSRAQWELISLLIRSWGEGLGLASQPSIFIVGDRKQSIYRFRDAESGVLQDAARFIHALRPAGNPRRSIARSFRAVPELLQFVNELFAEIADRDPGAGRFTYTDSDRFPPLPASASGFGEISPERLRREGGTNTDGAAVGAASRRFTLGAIASDDPDACAAGVADEIARVLREDTVRDRKTGVARQAAPGDIAILFRSRASHREFERELESRGIPSYVYKGLGFFDADETKDVMALIRYLADPGSDLRAAAFLRSRFLRLSDRGLALLAPQLAAALTSASLPDAAAQLGDEDRRVLDLARRFVPAWVALVDRVPPAELLDLVLAESAYAYELRGARRLQAWENLKKMRSLVRRIQNHGYATLPRIADHLDSLTAGDESNAVLEALDAVNLMTVHASKGLEFPIVFLVNLAKGASGPPRPVRVIVDVEDDPSVSIGPFVSEMDEADREREKHETRRLLYVAATRARDRLYLSSALKEGAVVPGRGSLGEVLPASVKELISKAGILSAKGGVLSWTSASGVDFEVRACPVPVPTPPATA
jgi:ATP-dependent helicase/nuclease subunit A